MFTTSLGIFETGPLEWVFSWRRGRVNYLCLTDFFFFNLFVSKIYFFARCELQLMS